MPCTTSRPGRARGERHESTTTAQRFCGLSAAARLLPCAGTLCAREKLHVDEDMLTTPRRIPRFRSTSLSGALGDDWERPRRRGPGGSEAPTTTQRCWSGWRRAAQAARKPASASSCASVSPGQGSAPRHHAHPDATCDVCPGMSFRPLASSPSASRSPAAGRGEQPDGGGRAARRLCVCQHRRR